jgi:SPW repeat
MAPNEENRRAGSGLSNRWPDWANLVLGVWLFISPWVVNFGRNPADWAGATPGPVGDVAAAASWNAWIVGIVVLLLAASAISRLRAWQEWLNLALGVWLFIAPWALAFASLSGAAWDHWIVGALVFLLAAWDLRSSRRSPAPAAAAYAGTKPGAQR